MSSKRAGRPLSNVGRPEANSMKSSRRGIKKWEVVMKWEEEDETKDEGD
jgi:hypothetical protein